jgi:hypothetical protein
MSTAIRIPASGSRFAALPAALLLAGNVLAADLIGAVLRGNAPAPATPVKLFFQGKEAGSATTDAAGRFVIRNLRPGVYDMRCGDRPAVRVQINDDLNEINCQG